MARKDIIIIVNIINEFAEMNIRDLFMTNFFMTNEMYFAPREVIRKVRALFDRLDEFFKKLTEGCF